MREIPVTSDPAEMRRWGEILYNENRELYDTGSMRGIRATVEIYGKDKTPEEREDEFFCTVYEYWKYDNNMKSIPITDDPAEIRKWGEMIYRKNIKLYNDRWMEGIVAAFDHHMPDATEQEKTDAFFRSVYNYWMYGNNTSEEFYFDFAHKTHEQKSCYMTHRMRFLYMEHLNPKEDRHWMANKWDAYQLMKPYYRRDAILISGEEDYESFCDFTQKHAEFVVKPVGLGKGVGIHKSRVTEESREDVFRELLSEIAAANEKLPNWSTASLILEEIITQDPAIGVLHPESVNSVRLVTVKVGDKVHIWYPRIDIGRGGSFLINAACGGIMAIIDPETGIILKEGIPEDGGLYEYHPDTGVRIKGFQIPRWNELIEMATDLMLNVVPGLRYVGWDMALSDKGWCVVEGNWAGEFVGDQLGYGRGLKKEFEALIGWKPEKDYWWET